LTHALSAYALSRYRVGECMADQIMLGKTARVTGTIRPDMVGEVMVSVRGGAEAFHAYAAEDGVTIAIGSRVLIVEYHPPRTVIVTRL
ncbi:hypothetical protein, partial [Frankia sp. Cj3]